MYITEHDTETEKKINGVGQIWRHTVTRRCCR